MSGKQHEGRAERLRSIPLKQAALLLGYERDPRDRARWRKDGSIISISGAIDLAVHAEGCSFLQALERLEPGSRRCPIADRWTRVRSHLAGERRLDPELLDSCRTNVSG